MNTRTITALPWEQIAPSPLQYRRTMSERALAELTESIKAHGVLQPILVRPRTGPDAERVPWECVFGHRRLLAIEGTDHLAIPAIVCAMTDEQVRLAQIAENLEREDVHPIEEGEGFAALIEHHGYTRERIAQEYGKSLSYVTGRLKLLQACPEVRKACLAGEIGSEVALLIARLRTDKLQQKALEAIHNETGEHVADAAKSSFREIKALLRRRFTLDLHNAPFDTEDMVLVPDTPACSACPKRAGNAPEFADLVQDDPASDKVYHHEKGNPNLCTDPDCYAAKSEHARAVKVAELEAKGKKVASVSQTAAAFSSYGGLKDTYVPLAQVKDQIKKAKGNGAAPQVITLLDPKTQKPVDVVKRADLRAVGIVLDAEKQAARDAAKRLKTAAAIDAANAGHKRLLRAVHDAMAGQPITHEALRIVARRLLEVSYDYGDSECEAINELYGWDGESTRRAPLHRLDAMDAGEITRLIVECCLVDNLHVYRLEEKPEALLTLAGALGIDAEATMREPSQTPASTPAEAAPAAKKGRKGIKAAAAEQGELAMEPGA